MRTRYAGGNKTAAFCTATTKYDLVPIYSLETIRPVALLSPTKEHIVSGSADGVLIGAVEDCAEGGGPVGTPDALGTICGLPLKR